MARTYATVTNGGAATLVIPGFVIAAGGSVALSKDEYDRIESKLDLSAITNVTVAIAGSQDGMATDAEVTAAVSAAVDGIQVALVASDLNEAITEPANFAAVKTEIDLTNAKVNALIDAMIASGAMADA